MNVLETTDSLVVDAALVGENAILHSELRRCRAALDAAIAKYPLLAATEYVNGAEKNSIGNLRAELGTYKTHHEIERLRKTLFDHMEMLRFQNDYNDELQAKLAAMTKERDEARAELADIMAALEVRKLYWDGTKYVEAQ